MRRRFPLVVAGWLATGVLATGAGAAMITVLGEPLTASAHRPLSSAEIEEALARTTPVAAAPPVTRAPASTDAPASTGAPTPGATPAGTPDPMPTGTSTPSPATSSPAAKPAGRSGVIRTAGGSVIARCSDGLVTLRSWSPAQGFQVDDVERGPAVRARVEFEADETDVKIEVRCSADGSPVHRFHD
ncbi:hypothetical protein ACFFMN_33295 [Planobispora siamensis]|uniref:Septum formation initiator n=1 Tax=Planobispora siamensis TaxID=936338 RepID=A0A8J3SDD3_9ACTN|nr:hypothetical protein [Planobispora siamensis]GIH92078.1 hypothetical protein Psi01_27080 [Planobispora siamensis]